jgi:MATE family multidrug resistance protein
MEDKPVNDASWWNRPAGGHEVFSLALPMVASTLSWTLMTFIDRMILQHVSGAAMSAAFSASIVWFAMLSLLWGICSYASTFVSQYFGDEQYDHIGPVVWQGVWLAVLFSPVAIGARWLAPALFADHGPVISALEIRFFQILCWGAPGMLAAQSLEAFFSGQGRTRVVMLVDATAVVVNLILACVLVLGWGGVASWGMEGAAWATVAAQWSRAAIYARLVLTADSRRRFNTLSMRLHAPLMVRLLRFGGPSGVQMLLDVGGFAVFVQMVGKLGLIEANAASLVFSISHVGFMPVWGLGMATVVLVGQKLGEDRPDLASRAAGTTLSMALGYMIVMSLLFSLAPNVFLSGFFGHDSASAADDLAVRQLAVKLLLFVSAYNIFDAAIIIFVSVLRGAGDTRFVMFVSAVMASLLAGTTWLGVEKWKFDVFALWTLITAWVWTLAVIYILRYRQGKWRSMRVIDQVHAHPRAMFEAPATVAEPV